MSSYKVDFVKDVRGYVLDYIKFADAKAAALLTFVGLLGAGISSLAPDVVRLILSKGKPWLKYSTLATLVLFGAALGLTLVFSVIALLPKTAPANASLASFPDIHQMGGEAYSGMVTKLGEDGVVDAYAKHTATLSTIVLKKFLAIKKATWFLLTAITLAFLAGVEFVIAKGVL